MPKTLPEIAAIKVQNAFRNLGLGELSGTEAEVIARVVMQAMLEPTEHMKKAGSNSAAPAACYKAMIDAAMNEEELADLAD